MAAPGGHSRATSVEAPLTPGPRGRWGQWVSGGSAPSSGPWPAGNPWGWGLDRGQGGQQGEGQPRGRQQVLTNEKGVLGHVIIIIDQCQASIYLMLHVLQVLLVLELHHVLETRALTNEKRILGHMIRINQ